MAVIKEVLVETASGETAVLRMSDDELYSILRRRSVENRIEYAPGQLETLAVGA